MILTYLQIWLKMNLVHLESPKEEIKIAKDKGEFDTEDEA